MTKTLDTVLDASLRPVRSQIELAATVVTGTALASLQSASALLDNAQAMVIEQYDAELEEYNQAIEEIELRDKQIAEKESAIGLLRMARDEAIGKISGMQSTVDDAETLVQEMQSTIDNLNAKITLARSEHGSLKRELDELKSLNPQRMKQQLVDTRKKLEERQKADVKKELELKESKRLVSTQRSRIAEMVTATASMEMMYADMKKRIERMDGDVDEKTWLSPDGQTQFYFYTFHWGLQTRALDPDTNLLHDLAWHIEVRTNAGICLIVSVNEWGAPVYPDLESFHKRWPAGLTEALQEKILTLLSDTHPLIVARHEWATGVDVTDLPIAEKYQQQLAESGVVNLFDIIRRIPDQLSHDVKGFGIATARQVRAKCLSIVKEWEADHKKEVNAA